MVHFRIVVPNYQAQHVLDLLENLPSAYNVIYLERAARKPEGDVILVDVAREDASVVVSDLRELEVDLEGSIAIEKIDSAISAAALAAEKAAKGSPADAVIWEEVESRTSENIELSGIFLAFMALACLIASVGIFLDSPILIVGAMIVGPEFGPHRRPMRGAGPTPARRRQALAEGARGRLPGRDRRGFRVRAGGPGGGPDADDFIVSEHPLTDFISHPDSFSFIVAFMAGIAGVLSLTSTKSGALVGVLVSVTTIPAAANIGVAAAYTEWSEFRGAVLQLTVNLAGIFLAGLLTLYIQRLLYMRRRRDHLDDAARVAAGLPLGRSRREASATYKKPHKTETL